MTSPFSPPYSPQTSPRPHIEVRLNPAAATWQEAIRTGLQATPKSLPPQFFYDDQGSELFEKICQLPEYYPTRTEAAILAEAAAAIAQAVGPVDLVELGSGSATKTRYLLDALTQSMNTTSPLRFVPVDVSEQMLRQSAEQIQQEYAELQIWGMVADYLEALPALPFGDRRRLVIFLGSTLGNFSPANLGTFFAQLQATLRPGDFFLLGIDLQKPVPILEAAYNDTAGVTAAFNLNMLRHLNRLVDADFDLSQFQHRAFYDGDRHQIEMHLVSQVDQTVTLKGLDLSIQLAAGESIHTETSRKFTIAQMKTTLDPYGLTLKHHWCDPQSWFGVLLAQCDA